MAGAAGRISRRSAGEGTRTLTPSTRTPDFKSGAYHQFRHPGGLRISLGYSPGENLKLDGILAGGMPTTNAISWCGWKTSAAGLPVCCLPLRYQVIPEYPPIE